LLGDVMVTYGVDTCRVRYGVSKLGFVMWYVVDHPMPWIYEYVVMSFEYEFLINIDARLMSHSGNDIHNQ